MCMYDQKGFNWHDIPWPHLHQVNEYKPNEMHQMSGYRSSKCPCATVTVAVTATAAATATAIATAMAIAIAIEIEIGIFDIYPDCTYCC